MPAVYEVIMSMTQPYMLCEPPYLLIKLVCEKSDDTSLKKRKFIRYLEEYKEQGLFCRRPKLLTSERKKYYEAIRKKKMNTYILKNRESIERYGIMRQQKV